MFAAAFSGFGRGGKIRAPSIKVLLAKPESQCRQTIVCDCELPAFCARAYEWRFVAREHGAR